MIIYREPQEVTDWMIVFHTDCQTRLFRAIPGRFKHVSLLGWAQLAKVWIMLDVSLSQSKMIVLPESQAARDRIAIWTKGCAILRMEARVRTSKKPRFGGWCVPSARHMLGLSGGAVLTPDHLWKECLRNGAKVIFDDGQFERSDRQPGS